LFFQFKCSFFYYVLLSEYENINVVSEAEDVFSAITKIDQHKPDIIFLDIQMPGESGFDLLHKIKTSAKVIFVTAFDEFAIRVFEVNALDYLLKPINPERLAHTITRLNQPIEPESIDFRQLDYENRLFLYINDGMKFLKIKSIIYIQSAGDYTELFTYNGISGLTLKSMKEWDNRLPEKYFCRIHRSTIINMEYVDSLEEWFNYSYKVFIKGINKPFVISRRYVAKLKKTLG
jgi:two-component system, LytTR family, response regulator